MCSLQAFSTLVSQKSMAGKTIACHWYSHIQQFCEHWIPLTFAEIKTTTAANSVNRDSYCMLLSNMMAHKFLPLPGLFCAWHWSSMSATMSVYLSNPTKWPPITCPIDLSWWWKLVDKTFIPPHYCSTFISSKIKASVNTVPLTWDKSAHRCWMCE